MSRERCENAYLKNVKMLLDQSFSQHGDVAIFLPSQMNTVSYQNCTVVIVCTCLYNTVICVVVGSSVMGYAVLAVQHRFESERSCPGCR